MLSNGYVRLSCMIAMAHTSSSPSSRLESGSDAFMDMDPIMETDERWEEINKKYRLCHIQLHLKELEAMTQLFYASTYQDSDAQLEMQTRAIPNILLREKELNVIESDRVFWDKRNVDSLHPAMKTSLPDLLSAYLTPEQMQHRTKHLETIT